MNRIVVVTTHTYTHSARTRTHMHTLSQCSIIIIILTAKGQTRIVRLKCGYHYMCFGASVVTWMIILYVRIHFGIMLRKK